MAKSLLLFLISFTSVNAYSQIVFEKGYFIDNAGQKHECLIKNGDWKDNPERFEYKTQEIGETKVGNIESVKEFGFYNIARYYRDTVKIDRSSDNLGKLSEDRNPVFNEEVMFLKVLVEGKANLYEYVDGNLIRYFYSLNNDEIEQLVYKSYLSNGNDIAKNVAFRQQLWNELKCPDIEFDKIEKIDYRKKDLVNFFREYSSCHDQVVTPMVRKNSRDFVHLTLRPRFNSSSLVVDNLSSAFRDTDFGTKTGFGFGIEGEFILPFRKNKWGILVEPTYQSYSSESTISYSFVAGGKVIDKADYSSIEIPLGVRHYFFLTGKSKLFVNASYVIDFSYKSTINSTLADGSSIASLDITSSNNLALGGGFKRGNQYSIEFRYHATRDLLSDYIFMKSEYKTLSVIVGYTLF